MSGDGLIDCLGYLSMALSLLQSSFSGPLNASVCSSIAPVCQYRHQYRREVLFQGHGRTDLELFGTMMCKSCNILNM